jgi:diacylglycerol kinase (ATP)
MGNALTIGMVVNPKANAGRDQGVRLRQFREALARDGHGVRMVETTGPGGGVACAQSLAGEVDVLLAVGGDGTFCEVVGGMLTADRGSVGAVAPVSFGTGNDVARHLGLRREAEVLTALRAYQAGGPDRVRRMDVLEVRCRAGGREVVRHGFLFAAVGFASDILRYTTPRVKRWFGPQLSYSVGFFRALAKWQPVPLRVSTERGQIEEPLVVALAANAPHAGGGGMRIAPGADLADGLSDVSLIRALGRGAIARQFFRLTQGTHIRHPRVDFFRSGWMEVDAATPQPVALDGDVVGETPLRVRVLRQAVPVVGGKFQV